MMDSRLDRLFILLDTGSNDSVRLAAAKQLGEVQRVQPNDLHHLLNRIKEYSSKPLWETRIAAGQATKAVLENVDPWPLSSDQCDKGDDQIDSILDFLNLGEIVIEYDLTKVTSQCHNLLSLDTTEDNDDLSEVPSGSNISKGRRPSTKKMRKAKEEQLLRQRKLINKELGIAMVDSLNIGVRSTDIVSNDDLQVNFESDKAAPPKRRLSSHEDAKMLVKGLIHLHETALKKLQDSGYIKVGIKLEKDKDISPETSCDLYSKDWPLAKISNEYIDNLFENSWEMRHGAAIALREIVRYQGKSAGKRSDLPKSINEKLNQLWLVDMALKAITVLALDKFGDFLFDQVIAPVRENAAQLLSCCVLNLPHDIACLLMKKLLEMLDSPNWETRHGGILGLKYSLSVVDSAVTKRILIESFDHIFKCLADPVDDVSAEAAAALVPVRDVMIEMIPEKAPKLIKFLWDHIADLDELTSSTSNIVLLLASLITTSSNELKPDDLTRSIPRLWPLLSHSSTSVRVSVLKALITLLKSQDIHCVSWMPEELLSRALRLIFQRSILETDPEASSNLEQVWSNLIEINHTDLVEKTNLLKTTSQYLNYWFCLALQPVSVPIDRSYPMWLNIGPDGLPTTFKVDGDIYIASYNSTAEVTEQHKKALTRCRMLGTRLLGNLFASVISNLNDSVEHQFLRDALKYLSDMFVHYMSTKVAHNRMISSWVLEFWATHLIELNSNGQNIRSLLPKNLNDQLNANIQDVNLCYDELATSFTTLQQIARDFVSSLKEASIDIPFTIATEKRIIFNLNQIHTLCDMNLEEKFTKVENKKLNAGDDKKKPNQDLSSMLTSKQANLKSTSKMTSQSHRKLSTSVLSSLSCALISWHLYNQDNLTIIIKSLLDSVDLETDECLQSRSIQYLISLLKILLKGVDEEAKRIGSIIEKVIAMVNQELTKAFSEYELDEKANPKIIYLDNLHKQAELMRMPRRQSAVGVNSNLKRPLSTLASVSETNRNDSLSGADNETSQRGSRSVLRRLAVELGSEFASKLPKLWSYINEELITFAEEHLPHGNDREPRDDKCLIERLNVLAVLIESLSSDYRSELLNIFSHLINLLSSSSARVRYHSTQCIGLMTRVMFPDVLQSITEKVIPLLSKENIVDRCGSIEAIAQIIDQFQLDWISHINMFVINVLRRMSDQHDQVRLLAAHCFGRLLTLMPLNSGAVNKTNTRDIIDKKSRQRDDERFIEQLLNPKELDHYKLPFEINTTLRSYQQDGINWLAFLNRFNLHGILCDEMGLGKTLMTVCMIAADHYFIDFNDVNRPTLGPSIIICPSTLTEHWLYEIEKFLPEKVSNVLNVVTYTGSQADRYDLRLRLGNQKDRKNSKEQPINLVITSYDIVRNDVDFLKEILWNYCVLDEGHMIKNVKTKLSRSIRTLTSRHRLILSGTPIQNNVTELWSLFDFLMPGFLGSERQFNVRYAKPILQSRDVKSSSREMEAGALAMESLHRQVLPFILRRLKEDVLDDLPPKIIQDYYCELSPIQQKLYEDFKRSRLCEDVTKKSIHEMIDKPKADPSTSDSKSKSHVFQALQYLKNVCNHPKLVLTKSHSHYDEIQAILAKNKSNLDDIEHSSKLKALKQLLIDCDIGSMIAPVEQPERSTQSNRAPQELDNLSIVNQHRALIFCQVKSMVNIIENDLLKKHLPNTTYLKLDGSVPSNQRHSIVSRFNNDPSIDVLLLTTQIGGLGLNLIGADTVIFVEHDWNPTRDLQAMDRAHRIGQKKVVNVYRLITKGTLEEKIMGLQKFKTMISNTVINQDNAGLGTMNVDQLLDLFEQDTAASESETISSKASFVDLLPELWDQQQYETEYDLTNFVSSLKN